MEKAIQKALDAMIFSCEYTVKTAIREFASELGMDLSAFTNKVIDVCNIHVMPEKNNFVECEQHKISIEYGDIPNLNWVVNDDYERLRECLAYLLFMIKEFFKQLVANYPKLKMNLMLDPKTTSYKLERCGMVSSKSIVFKIE